MTRVVQPLHPHVACGEDLDLVQGAGVLNQPPIGRQRHVEELQQQHAVHAVMAHHHHRLLGVAQQRLAQHVARPRHDVLQRFPFGKARELRRRAPLPISVRTLGADLGVGAHLPGAVVDVARPLAHLALDAANRRDPGPGQHTALQRTGEHRRGLPVGGDALGQRIGLGKAALGQRQLGTATKACGVDAFDVAVAAQQDFGHVGNLSGHGNESASRGTTSLPSPSSLNYYSPGSPDQSRIAMNTLELKLTDAVTLAVPASLHSVTTYVLLEQERWFEKEMDFLRRWLRPGMTVIDIGANHGVYSLPMARLVGPTGQVFAYEPGSETRVLLERSRDLNAATNLDISPLALSDGEREGRLVFGSSSELHALGDSGAGEAVRITSLDREDAARDWPSPDFVKIDAEGEEERIVSGGRNFFARHSPLIMFEIKAGEKVNEHLRALFPAMGYRLFRQLGGAPVLVPDDPQQPIDGYELNLFAAKPDRANALSQQGLLVEAIPTWVPGEDDPKKPDLFWGSQNFPPPISLSSANGAAADPGYRDSLAAYAAWRSTNRSVVMRCAALAFALRGLTAACARAPTPERLSTLARVAWEWGARAQSVGVLQHLLKTVRG